jgi:O-antigen ligase
VSLPFSQFTLSVGIIVLFVNWMLEGRWKEKINQLKGNTAFFLFSLIYLSLVFGIFYSSNFLYGLKELKLKLPLLLIPLVVSTSKPVEEKEKLYILALFCLSVLAASFYSAILYFSYFNYGGGNVREISHFVSHIRFSLMVNMALASLIWIAINNFAKSKYVRVLIFLVFIWLTFFLFILQSLTGITIFIVILAFFAIYMIVNLKKRLLKTLLISSLILFLLFPSVYITKQAISYFGSREKIDNDTLAVKTINGNLYTHNSNPMQYENGHLVWINVCWEELESQWEMRSKIPFDSNDKLGQPLSGTVVRYIASMGLNKDSIGIWQLDEIDISLIEAGATSVVFKENRFGLYPRLYQIFWEIDQFQTFGKISGSPLVQRLVFQRAALGIIRDNLLFGVGTGDLEDEFNRYYFSHEPNLDEEYWYLSHNQILTQWVQVGLWGVILFIVGWFTPIFIQSKQRDLLVIAFLLVISLSMLNEDTFQTHVGVSLASLFYSFLVFGSSRKFNKSIDDEQESI